MSKQAYVVRAENGAADTDRPSVVVYEKKAEAMAAMREWAELWVPEEAREAWAEARGHEADEERSAWGSFIDGIEDEAARLGFVEFGDLADSDWTVEFHECR